MKAVLSGTNTAEKWGNIMSKQSITDSLIECFGNDNVAASLKKLLTPIVNQAVEAAVAAAVASKDEEIRCLKDELQRVELQLNELEQYSRRMCVNISGIPENANEDAKKIVQELSNINGACLDPSDIDVAHRIGRQRPGKTRTIIARFATLSKRQVFYNARRALRGAHAPPGSQLTGDILANTFITDNLTQQNEFLMYQARQLKRKGKVFAVWSDQGRLTGKESQGASTKVFRSTDDLRSLCGDDPILHEAPATSQRSEAVSDTSGFTTVSSRRGRSAAKK